MRNRTVEFAVCSLIILALFWRQIHRIVGLSTGTGYTSYVILVPFLTAYLIWLGRERIFGAPEYSRVWGAIIAALALILYLATDICLGCKNTKPKGRCRPFQRATVLGWCIYQLLWCKGTEERRFPDHVAGAYGARPWCFDRQSRLLSCSLVLRIFRIGCFDCWVFLYCATDLC